MDSRVKLRFSATRGLPRGSWFEQWGNEPPGQVPLGKRQVTSQPMCRESPRADAPVWTCGARCSRHRLGPPHRIEGALTSQGYCSVILDDSLLPYAHTTFPDADLVLQHDHAPVHTAKIVKEHLETGSRTELLAGQGR
ncbi:uncharacterized protein [Dermacentor albipictus]|uniref:uncharacterized protein n=1 Tax=Dermacentor albipictus TaxID=60249 RepID=UPI0031FC720A